jgi:prophage DNA circulation protein
MTWRDRLRTEIALTSPSGQQFAAAWAGNPRTVEKRLGIFDYPKLPGAIVQDLDVGADSYPLSFYFEGDDNDLEAERFFTACKERGTWSVVHPVKGQKTLQLIRVTENVQPVSSGNMTLIDSEWIEPITAGTTASVTQLGEAVKAQAATLQEVAAGQLSDVVELDKPSKITAFKNAITAAVSKVNTTLAPLRQQAADIQAAALSVHRGITDGLNAVSLDVLSLGGQIQTLVTLPGQAITDISTRFEYYRGLISEMVGLEPDTPSEGGINTVAVQELVLTSALVAMASAASEGDLASREEAVKFIEDSAAAFIDVTEALDASQALYSDNAIDNQYFSQSQSFNDAALLTGRVTELLLRKSFDLAAARRFTLTRSRAPVEIAAEKYGDLDHLDFFISSNGLKGNDILLLPAGREVVVYL